MLGAEDGGSVGRLLFFVASVDLDDECSAPSRSVNSISAMCDLGRSSNNSLQQL